ncbi:MAG TPA: hypothetical protein VHM65_04810 [Candidatus Lustribacter sp.]|nr:hypothetical protein [Candidatus Lustribacter sp.]
MSTFEWVTLAVVLLVGLGWFLSYSAARLDRLHGRIEGTQAALDAQLVRRAEATLELANTGTLDAASALILAGAATESLDSVDDLDPAREAVESELTEALEVALSTEVVELLRAEGGLGEEALERVRSAGLRVQLARRFHNDAVTDARRVRRKVSVRVFRLAGHADMPRTFEFDDELPSAIPA